MRVCVHAPDDKAQETRLNFPSWLQADQVRVFKSCLCRNNFARGRAQQRLPGREPTIPHP